MRAIRPLLGFLGQNGLNAYLIYYVGGPAISVTTRFLIKVIPPGGQNEGFSIKSSFFQRISRFSSFFPGIVEFTGSPAIIIILAFSCENAVFIEN